LGVQHHLLIVPEPEPGKETAVNPFDHEKLDAYQAAIDSALVNRLDADLYGASCRGVGLGHVSLKCGEAPTKTSDTCIIIPTYNNVGTLADVIRRTLRVTSDLIIVDDGSTDGTRRTLASMKRMEVLTHPFNRGKGEALMTGIRRARELGYRRAITLDSDNQHDPADIRKLEEAAARHPSSLVIGVRDMRAAGAPLRSRFGLWVSNLGVFFLCGHRVADAQSGFRSYPIDRLLSLEPRTPRFEFEYEVLLRSSWAGVPFAYTPIAVRYPRGKDRLSHFRPLRDCFRVFYFGIRTAFSVRLQKFVSTSCGPNRTQVV